MLNPRATRLRDYDRVFYGHAFDSHTELRQQIECFLSPRGLRICDPVKAGEWLWPELVRQMRRSAFCIFETASRNQNTHIELGYALARRIRTVVLIERSSGDSSEVLANLPSDLAGLVQVRYDQVADVCRSLKSAVPFEWICVTRRLTRQVEQLSALDEAYLRCLLRQNVAQSTRFSSLVAEARCIASGSSNTALADFMREHDELLDIETSVGDMPGDVTPNAAEGLEAPMVDEFRIRVHAPYRPWLESAVAELKAGGDA